MNLLVHESVKNIADEARAIKHHASRSAVVTEALKVYLELILAQENGWVLTLKRLDEERWFTIL